MPSPDGAWIATAETDQTGGPGNAWIGTTVSLRKVNGTLIHGKPTDVLSYGENGPVKKPYMLSDENAGGGVDLQLSWPTPTHLQITYTGEIDPIYVKVTRVSNIDVSYQQNRQ